MRVKIAQEGVAPWNIEVGALRWPKERLPVMSSLHDENIGIVFNIRREEGGFITAEVELYPLYAPLFEFSVFADRLEGTLTDDGDYEKITKGHIRYVYASPLPPEFFSGVKGGENEG